MSYDEWKLQTPDEGVELKKRRPRIKSLPIQLCIDCGKAKRSCKCKKVNNDTGPSI